MVSDSIRVCRAYSCFNIYYVIKHYLTSVLYLCIIGTYLECIRIIMAHVLISREGFPVSALPRSIHVNLAEQPTISTCTSNYSPTFLRSRVKHSYLGWRSSGRRERVCRAEENLRFGQWGCLRSECPRILPMTRWPGDTRRRRAKLPPHTPQPSAQQSHTLIHSQVNVSTEC